MWSKTIINTLKILVLLLYFPLANSYEVTKVEKIKNLHSTKCETFLGSGFDHEEAHFANNYSEECFEKYYRTYKSVMEFNDILIFVEILSIQQNKDRVVIVLEDWDFYNDFQKARLLNAMCLHGSLPEMFEDWFFERGLASDQSLPEYIRNCSVAEW